METHLERHVGATQRSAALHFDAEVLHQLDLKVDHLIGQSILGNFGRTQTADEVVAFENGQVGIAESGEEGGARNGGRAAAEQSDLGTVARAQIGTGNLRRQHLGNFHFLEHLKSFG